MLTKSKATHLGFHREMYHMTPATPYQHRTLYRMATKNNGLSHEACDFMRMDDYFVLEGDSFYNWTEWIFSRWADSPLFVSTPAPLPDSRPD